MDISCLQFTIFDPNFSLLFIFDISRAKRKADEEKLKAAAAKIIAE
jgi:hypothetical protein